MNKYLVRGTLAAFFALGAIAPISAGRGGGIAAGVFGGMLAGSMIANAANNRNYGGGTTYYVESPAAPMRSEYYNAGPGYDYNQGATPNYYGMNQGYNNANNQYEEELAALAQQNSDLRARVKQTQANYADLKNQYDEILAAGREYKRKFLALERKYSTLEKQYYDLQLRCDVLEDSSKNTMARKSIVATPQESAPTQVPTKEVGDAGIAYENSTPVMPQPGVSVQ